MVISGDSYAVAQRFWEFSGICTAPVRLVIALIFLYKFVALLLVRDYKSCPMNQCPRLEFSRQCNDRADCMVAQLSTDSSEHFGKRMILEQVESINDGARSQGQCSRLWTNVSILSMSSYRIYVSSNFTGGVGFFTFCIAWSYC